MTVYCSDPDSDSESNSDPNSNSISISNLSSEQIYAFALDPLLHQPSGVCDFGKIYDGACQFFDDKGNVIRECKGKPVNPGDSGVWLVGTKLYNYYCDENGRIHVKEKD